MMKAFFSRYSLQSLEEMQALKRVLAYLEMFLDIGNARGPKKASLILQKMVQGKILPVSGLVLVQIVWLVSNFMYRRHSLTLL